MPRRHSKTAALCFLILIPGYFVYHTMAARGLLPLSLGGYTTQVSLPMLPVLTAVYLFGSNSRPRPQLDLAFFGFVALFLGTALLHLAFGTNDPVARSHLSVVIQFLVTFFATRLTDPLEPRFRKQIFLSFAVLTAILFSLTVSGTFSITPPGTPASDYLVANYQGLGLVYCLLAMYCAALSTKHLQRLLVFGIGSTGLVFNGSRAEVIGFLGAMLVIEYSYARNRTFFVTCLGSALAITAGAIGAAFTLLPESNRVRSLVSLAGDASVGLRFESIQRAVDTIREYPLLGDYANYPPGEWAHSIISVWVDLGLLGLVLFSALLFGPLARLVFAKPSAQRQPLHVLTLTVLAFTAALCLGAKGFTYQMVPVAVGLSARHSMLRILARQAASSPDGAGTGDPIAAKG